MTRVRVITRKCSGQGMHTLEEGLFGYCTKDDTQPWYRMRCKNVDDAVPGPAQQRQTRPVGQRCGHQLWRPFVGPLYEPV